MNVDGRGILEIKRRREVANYYYDNFRKHYETKKFSKASEFLWGALNALVYAIGLFYGRKLTTHRSVVDFAKELASAYKDKEMGELINDAETIHANFFHDFMDEYNFENYRRKTEKLLKRVVEILDHEMQTQFQGR
ncbi:MAG: PaREP1 family protein [Euryarchaeota archaeon]|nr:PaREP1 family protein [Euryarchaeota archaeon]